MQDFPAVMNVKQCAAYVGVPISSIYYLAERRRIPCRKAGKELRFLKTAIDAWLAGDPLATANKEIA